MKGFVGVTDNDWFAFLSQQPNKIWGTDLHFSLLLFSVFLSPVKASKNVSS